MSRLAERIQIAAGFVPVDMAVAANNGDWVSLANFQRCAIVFYKAAGAVGEAPTITVQQATDNAGTGAKALNFTRIVSKNNADVQTVGAWTVTDQAAANTYALAAGNTQAIVVIEITAAMLDVTGGFDFLRATVADVGVTAQLGALLYLLFDGRYSGSAETLPSVLA